MAKEIGKLMLVRHSESEWNKLGLWTGWKDVRLTEYGFLMAKKMGSLILDQKIDETFCSKLVRAQETLDEILKVLNLSGKIPEERSEALNERDYGDYTGKNKWEMQKEIGEEGFQGIRRGWDYPVPGGENLKMVYARVEPYYLNSILPELLKGKNVLVAAHGNSLRALIKYVEKIDDKQIEKTEMPFNTVLIYDVDEQGHSIHKEIREVK